MSMIDFSMIPTGQKPKARKLPIPLLNFLIAFGIMAVVVGYMLFVLLVLKIDQPMISVAPVSIAFCLAGVGIVIWLLVAIFRKYVGDDKVMEKFAQVNGFEYEKPKTFERVDAYYIPMSAGLTANNTFMKFRVEGETNGKNFELYGLWGQPLAASVHGSGIGSMTVLRVLAENDGADLELKDGYGYAVIYGPIYTREAIRKLFSMARIVDELPQAKS